MTKSKLSRQELQQQVLAIDLMTSEQLHRQQMHYLEPLCLASIFVTASWPYSILARSLKRVVTSVAFNRSFPLFTTLPIAKLWMRVWYLCSSKMFCRSKNCLNSASIVRPYTSSKKGRVLPATVSSCFTMSLQRPLSSAVLSAVSKRRLCSHAQNSRDALELKCQSYTN